MQHWSHGATLASLPSVPLGLSHLLPDRPGLYIVLITNEAGAAIIGYVGIATVSLRRRWYGHRQAAGKVAAVRALARTVRLAETPNYVLIHYDVSLTTEPELRAAERAIIWHWCPPCNEGTRSATGTLLMVAEPSGSGALRHGRGPVYTTPDRPQRRIYVSANGLEGSHVAGA